MPTWSRCWSPSGSRSRRPPGACSSECARCLIQRSAGGSGTGPTPATASPRSWARATRTCPIAPGPRIVAESSPSSTLFGERGMSTFVGLFVGFLVCMAIVFPAHLVAFTEKDFNYGQRAWLASWPILGFFHGSSLRLLQVPVTSLLRVSDWPNPPRSRWLTACHSVALDLDVPDCRCRRRAWD
jgi:hypothetical protein